MSVTLPTRVELHGFADASEKRHGAMNMAAAPLIIAAMTQIKSAFVISKKRRVAPVKSGSWCSGLSISETEILALRGRNLFFRAKRIGRQPSVAKPLYLQLSSTLLITQRQPDMANDHDSNMECTNVPADPAKATSSPDLFTSPVEQQLIQVQNEIKKFTPY
ncbi:hypothetical protein TNIN_193111 [Trichonephila inaurata madagascariensis]|uniref:Uncharacterized protein n=1 Tax=Trichonephila inaurata madagascariensis TaxID=2747483 RepID=A0A8X6YNB3_9ARAC|nr:hypothetical protein TNIN_193111 [Trichonephila inaurata madagascariensis]